MSLSFQSQIQLDGLADEQITSNFEVIMPKLKLLSDDDDSIYSKALGFIGADTYAPIVEEVVFGVRNFKTTTRRVRTGWCNVPEDIENYHDVSLTFFCSNNMLTAYYLAKWKSLIFNDEGEYYNLMTNYKKNIEIEFFGPGSIGILDVMKAGKFTLVGCFPYSQENYVLKYEPEPKRLRITQKFKVDKITFSRSDAKAAITKELISAPSTIVSSAVGKISDSIFGTGSQYSVQDTYS